MFEPKVFVSYSWGMEEQTKIVADLEVLCKARGIELILDKNVLKHGDRIKTFMDDLAKAEHIITVFSKPYFKSKWCMYELLHTFQRGEFQQRAHHLLADDCELQDQAYRLEMVAYWSEQHKLAKERINGHDPQLIPDEIKAANLIRDISQKINEMMNFAEGILITKLSDLKVSNYSQLLDTIKPTEPDETKKLFATTPDSAFLTEIKCKIAEELSNAEVELFRDLLKQELDKVLEKLQLDNIGDSRADLVADGLILALKFGGSEVLVITSALTRAAMHCFDKKRGKFYHETRAQHEAIKDVIEQILGWLVLAAVTDGYAQNLKPATNFPAIYFELPVQTSAGVEVIVSRSFQRQARFMAKGDVISADCQLNFSTDQFSWKTSETVELLKRMLWNQVFPDAKKETSLSLKETNKLNAELEIRRVDEWAGEHHVLAIESQNLIDDVSRHEVYQQLLTELNNLTLVHFGLDEQQPIFYAPELQMMGAINNFLKNINKAMKS